MDEERYKKRLRTSYNHDNFDFNKIDISKKPMSHEVHVINTLTEILTEIKNIKNEQQLLRQYIKDIVETSDIKNSKLEYNYFA